MNVSWWGRRPRPAGSRPGGRRPAILRLETLDPRLALCAFPHDAVLGEDVSTAPLDDYSLVQTEYQAFAASAAPGPAANGLPLLESLPGAPTAAYLDFDGFSGNGYGGNQTFTPYDTNGDPANFSATEAANITAGWRRMAQYMAPFNINVTTIVPTVPFSWNVISNSLTGVGYSYLQFNGFAPSAFNPSGDLLNRTTGILHELGHNFGLAHQSEYDLLGGKTREYRNGYDSLHGAIMGIDYFGSVPKWYLGHPSNSPSTLQDDVARMAALIHQHEGASGDGFRADDFGGTVATATPLATADGVQSASGIIERLNDADVFSFSSAGGTVTIDAVRDGFSGVDLRIDVLAADGTILGASDTIPNDQHLTLSLPAGTFYALVAGHGDYGDLGAYRLSVQSLPDGWTHADVGSVGLGGSSGFASGTYTVAGSGSGISGTADEFQFAYQTLTGDGTIIARVTTVENTDASAKAGVMIRESLSGGSKHAFMLATPSNGTWLRSRTSTGGASADSPRVNEPFSPVWLKLARAGNTITGSTSADGINWAVEGSASVSMSATVLIGLATTATDDNDLNTSTYDNVSVTGNLGTPGPTLNGLPAPTGVSAGGATSSGLNLSWNDIAGESGYQVERSIDGGAYSVIATVPADTTSYADSGLLSDSRYFYRVRANDATGTSVPSSIANALTRPGAVTDLSVTAWTDTKLIVNWRDISGDTGYRIERSSDNLAFSPVGTVGVNVPSFTDTGLSPATQYYYRVVTLDVSGGAATSATVSATSRISAVGNFAFGAISSNQINLQWNDGAGETGYRVERSTDNETFATIGNPAANATTFADNSVAPLGEYYYRVTPMNGSTPGLDSTTIFVGTPGGPLPAPWVSQDIGATPGRGAAGFDDGTFTLISAGADLSGTADSFHFVHQPVSGDGTIIARVAQIEDTDDNADVGVMFRESGAAGSRYVALVVTKNEGVKLRSRTAVGGDAGSTPLAGTAPLWVRLDRFGRTFRAQTSIDGQTWTQVTEVTLNLPNNLLVGLASTSRDSELLNTSSLDHVSVGLPLPLAQADEYTLLEDASLATSSLIETVVAAGSAWKYLDDATNQATAWRASGFNDAAWTSGPGPLGFGDPGLGTTTRAMVGGQPVITTYFRHAFSLTQVSEISRLLVELQRDDGAAVYFNGVEIVRSNLATDAAYGDLAPARINDAGELAYNLFAIDVSSLPIGTLVEGTNILAAEVHQQAATSTDLRFDLALRAIRSINPGPAANDLHFDPALAGIEIVQPPAHGMAAAVAANFTYTPDANYFGLDAFMYRVVAPPVAIVPLGSTWRYLDNGSNQGIAWQNTSFNDAAWPVGPAQLGYGDGDEATVVGFGPSTTNKFATTYFRHTITLPDGAAARDLSLRLLRDDAAAIYLNGVEVYRDANLSAAAAFNQYATSDIAAEGTIITIPLPGTTLQSGDNVIAVEIHQGGPASSDVSFDLELIGRFVSAPGTVSLTVTPVDDEPTPLADSYELDQGQSLTVAAPGVLTNDANPDGEAITAAVASPPAHGTLSLAADGSFTYTPAAGHSGADSFSYRVSDGGPLALVPPGAVWKYLDNGSNQGTAWRAAEFDDLAWDSGAAQLGYGEGDEATVVDFGPNANSKFITTYFRHAFQVADAAAHLSLDLRLLRDDGAAVYLNGVEIARDNLAAGADFDDLAASAVGGDDESRFFQFTVPIASLPAGTLRTGTNVLAVEIHQAAADSSDVSFDLELMSALYQGPATVDLMIQSTAVRGDFTGDDHVRAEDIDALYVAIAAGSTEPQFDLNNDSAVNQADVEVLVSELVETTVAVGTRFGDANLDGAVDRSDVTITLANLTYVGPAAWSRGDFTGDGRVDLADVGRQQQNLELTPLPAAQAQSALATAHRAGVRSASRHLRSGASRLPPAHVDLAMGDAEPLTSAFSRTVRASRRLHRELPG